MIGKTLLGPAFCLALLCLSRSSAIGQTVNFVVDPTKSVQSISPYIYGVNGVLNQSQYQNLNLTFERAGGDRWTAYNWTNNASNAGSDYFYENDDYLNSSTTPGAAVLPILQNAASLNAAALITIPINGYVAATPTTVQVNPSAPGYSPATSLNGNGQHNFVPEFPTTSDNTSNIPNAVYQDQFISWVQSNFPNGFAASSSQPIFISLDNEPDLWSSTHPEVHPAATTYAEMIQSSVAYSTAIKSVGPNALVFGPASYGWEGFQSLQAAPASTADNKATDPFTGKAYSDFLSYYLAQMNLASQAAGKRLLDVEDVHWYPEATGLNASGAATRITGDDNSPGVVAARLQAPRSLWDPTYVESSWITQDSTGGKAIQLIPRLNGEINANYPGTKFSISEYNYGGGTDISGGIAEADVLGIFGVHGVFSAAEWPLASKEPFILGAMQMYRNYDGKGGTFGDTSVSATNSDIQDTSIYASTSSTTPGKMVLVALNKTPNPIATKITLNNSYNYTSFAVYQLTSGSTINAADTNASPAYVNTYPIADLSNFTMAGYSVNTLALLLPAPAGTIFDWNTTAATATDWTAGSNWIDNGSPDSPGFGIADVARFGNMATIAAGKTVNLNSNETIAQLLNQNTNSWTLASGNPGTNTLTLHEITQSSSAGLAISAPLIIDGTNQLTFDGAGVGRVTVGGISSGGTASSALVKSSPGVLQILGAPKLNGGSTLSVGSGTLEFNVAAGTASIGPNVNATVASGATLQLAGTVSALSDGSAINPASGNLVNIANNGSLAVTSGNQSAGAITGSGATDVQAGADLTASQIIQTSLTIEAGSTITIRPSGAGTANGIAATGVSTVPATPPIAAIDPFIAIQAALAENAGSSDGGASSQNILAILGDLTAAETELKLGTVNGSAFLRAEYRLSHLQSASLISEDALLERIDIDKLLWSREQSADAAFALSEASAGASSIPVPEPSTLLLAAIGMLGVCGFRRRRSVLPREIA